MAYKACGGPSDGMIDVPRTGPGQARSKVSSSAGAPETKADNDWSECMNRS